jgi:integrase
MAGIGDGLRAITAPLSNMSMLKCLRSIRGDAGGTVHGFRSSFRGWTAEHTSYPREIVETCLAHAVGGAVELAYRRTDLTRPPAEQFRSGSDGGHR